MPTQSRDSRGMNLCWTKRARVECDMQFFPLSPNSLACSECATTNCTYMCCHLKGYMSRSRPTNIIIPTTTQDTPTSTQQHGNECKWARTGAESVIQPASHSQPPAGARWHGGGMVEARSKEQCTWSSVYVEQCVRTVNDGLEAEIGEGDEHNTTLAKQRRKQGQNVLQRAWKHSMTHCG